MQRSGILFRSTCAAFLVCVALPGCGVKYPYYTLEGAQEARIVEVHINEKQSVKVVMTETGIQDQTYQLLDSGEEMVERGDVKVTFTRKGPFTIEKKVEYKGKEIDFHEPIL